MPLPYSEEWKSWRVHFDKDHTDAIFAGGFFSEVEGS